jgi:hypothetical protein
MGSNQGYKAGVSIPPIDVSQRSLELSNVHGVLRCHEVLSAYESVDVYRWEYYLTQKIKINFKIDICIFR